MLLCEKDAPFPITNSARVKQWTAFYHKAHKEQRPKNPTCAVGSHNQAAQGRHGLALNWNLRCKILLFKSPFFTKASICFGLDVLRLLMSNMPHKMLMYGAL